VTKGRSSGIRREANGLELCELIEFIDGHLAVIATEPAVLVQIGPLAIRWYSLAYIGGMAAGWWLLTRMLGKSGAPLTKSQLSDYFVWAMLGVIVGGRLGYVLFYDLPTYLADPLAVFATWRGGMSFHGGGLGLLVATMLFARGRGLQGLRIFDYVWWCSRSGKGWAGWRTSSMASSGALTPACLGELSSNPAVARDTLRSSMSSPWRGSGCSSF
jgi:hypothetical protein